ncbi:protein kinase [Nocardioides sp. WS12]|uniref:protein kinase domain-containing protein n=1 Tax=Nocardioides sp. WS12 TaxID=2486272 RepID=UPI0015FD680B|nr:protein kinase [Nocardioides sp. WS12]
MARIPGVGDLLGPYRITRELGAGGMGIVFEAIEEGLGRRVALKVLSLQLASEPEFRTRFKREASVLARSDSPHIIQVYSHGEQDGCLYLATQFVSGGDLAARVAGEGLPAPDVSLDIAAQVASALADAHAVGVIHRDVKPHNVLLRSGQGQVHAYLCDFGIARDGDSSLTSSGVVAGTYAYLAPERFRGEAATPASDTYALGCLLWFLLTGRPPYDGGLVQLAHQHEFSPIPQLPGASDQLNGFLLRAMAKDPAARHSSAAAAAAALRAIRASGRVPDQHFVVPPPATPPYPSYPSGPSYPSSPSAPSAPSYVVAASVPPPLAAPIAQPASPPPSYATPNLPTPVPRSRRGPLAAVIAVLAALVIGVGGGVAWHFLRDDGGGTDSTNPTLSPEPQETPTDGETVDPPGARVGPVTPADVNGDGNDDTILIDNSADQTLVLTSDEATDTGFGDFETWAGTAYGSAKVVRGDFSGDGWTDLALVETDRVQVARSNGVGFEAPEDWGDVQLPARFKVTAGDFDGDGVTDLAYLTGAGEDFIAIDVALSDGSTFGTASNWAGVEGWKFDDMKIGAGDFDGDGDADLIELGKPSEGGVDLRLFRSERDTFADNELWLYSATWEWGRTHPVIGDFDGDGDADVVVMLDEGNARFVRILSEGTTPELESQHVDVDDVAYADARPVAADTDGDGTTDLVLLDRSTATVRLFRYGSDGLEDTGRLAAGIDAENTVVVGITR